MITLGVVQGVECVVKRCVMADGNQRPETEGKEGGKDRQRKTDGKKEREGKRRKKEKKNIDEEIHSTCSSTSESRPRRPPVEPRCSERMWVFTTGVVVHPTSVFRDVCAVRCLAEWGAGFPG